MQKKLLVVVLGTLFALPAFADDAPAAAAPAAAPAAAAPAPAVTSNLTLVSNYLYRGISQSGNNPAIQGGFDYTHSSGFYAGTWGSSISWLGDAGIAAGAGLELDTYFGIKNSFATDFSYDVGFLRYNYPGNYVSPAPMVPGTTTQFDKGDTNEIYALIGWKWFTLKYSDSLGSTFTMPNASGTSYIDLSASYAIGDSGYTLGAHYGVQTYMGTTSDAMKAATPNSDPTYSDYRVSVSKDFGNTYAVGLTFSGTNVKTGTGAYYTTSQGKNLGQSIAVVNVTRTF